MASVDATDDPRAQVVDERPQRPLGVRGALRISAETMAANPLGYVLTLLVTQSIILLLLSPVISLLYRVTLDITGFDTLGYDTLGAAVANPLIVAMIVTVAVILVAVALAELETIFILAEHHQTSGGTTAGRVLRQLRGTMRKLLGWQSLLVIGYLLLLVPLAHFGLSATLTQRIAVPPFVSEELAKSEYSSVAYTLFQLVVAYLNLRLIFTIPLVSATTAGFWRSMVTSWRLSRRRARKVFGLIAAISVLGLLTTFFGGLTSLGLTPVTDRLLPALSPLAAAMGLAGWQILSFVVTALFTVAIAQGLVAMMHDWLPRLGPSVWNEHELVGQAASSRPHRDGRRLWRVAALVTVVVFVAATIVNLPRMRQLAEVADSEVMAHRGFTQGGVENTLPALSAAKAAGADRVEFDVMETNDGKFVVMHDANLARLTGQNLEVKNLTQAELMELTVRADGMAAPIPSLEQWIQLSVQLDLPQLLEIKLHGGESADLLPRLLAVLDAAGVANFYTYHSLDRAVVEQLNQLRPELRVGFIVPLNLGGVPQVDCDFLVVEQQSYSEGFLHQAWRDGYEVVIWTVNDPEQMGFYFTDGVDAMITDRPDLAKPLASSIAEQQGLTDRLLDRIRRPVGS